MSAIASELFTATIPTALLPNLNAQTNPFWQVQELLDQTAYFNMLSLPAPPRGDVEIRQTGQTVGFNLRQSLHRFQIDMAPPSLKAGMRAANLMGRSLGELVSRWYLVPENYYALPNQVPPAVALDPSRPQRFVMLDSLFRFAGTEDGFEGFGAGSTFPEAGRLAVGAVGNMTRGFGKFAGHEGIYVINGILDPSRGFTGSIIARVYDFDEDLRAASVPPVVPIPPPPMDDTYLLLRYEKQVEPGPDGRPEPTPGGLARYAFDALGVPIGANTANPLRFIELGFTTQGRQGIRSSLRLGAVVGALDGNVTFPLLRPSGTAEAPAPYQSYNTMTFFDARQQILGTFRADVLDGRSITLKLPGMPDQQAVRFGGVGPVGHGSGMFRGIRGMWSDNSSIGIAPFATVGSGVFRIYDPDGKYRLAPGGAARAGIHRS